MRFQIAKKNENIYNNLNLFKKLLSKQQLDVVMELISSKCYVCKKNLNLLDKFCIRILNISLFALLTSGILD